MKLARAAWYVALLVGVTPAAAHTQGFELNEIGSCAIGRGQAVTAAPCKDPSQIYWNPAAPTMLSGWSAYFGASWINVRGSFTSDTTGTRTVAQVPPSFPPMAFVNYTAPSHQWAAGLGIFAPYGLTSQWPTGFSGNFVAQKAALATVYVQPNFAWQLNKDWSVGGGPIYGYSEVQLIQALDLSAQSPAPGITFGMLGIPKLTQFGTAQVKASSSAWGFSLGVHGSLTPDWQVGARYMSQLQFRYTGGTVSFRQVLTGLLLPTGSPICVPSLGVPCPFAINVDSLLTPQFLTPGGPLVPQGASTSITHPWQAELGLAYSGFSNWLLELDFLDVGFSSFKTLKLNFNGPAAADSTTIYQGYGNSWTVRAGAEHGFASGIKGRLGFTYVNTPVPDASVNPVLPDQNRQNYTIGGGFPLGATWTLDAAFLYVHMQGRRGTVEQRNSSAQTAASLNTGWYELNANILSLSLKANF